MQQAGQSALDALTKAPVLAAQQTTLPGLASPSAPAAPPLARRDPTEFELPSGLDPSKMVTGHASYNGPPMDNEAALSGLRGAFKSDDQPSFGGDVVYSPHGGGPDQRYHVGEKEALYKQAALGLQTDNPNSPNYQSVAPGAGQYAADTLKSRLHDEDFFKDIDQGIQGNIMKAGGELNPTVQAGANAAAQRAALPAKVNADAAVRVAELRNQDPYYTEMANTLRAQREGGGTGDLKSVSRSGFTLQSNPNLAPYFSAITQAQKVSGGLFGGNPVLDQARNNLMAILPPRLSAAVREALETGTMDQSQFSREEVDQINELYTAMGGK